MQYLSFCHWLISPSTMSSRFIHVHPKELKSGSQTGICTLMFIAVLFTIANMYKQLKHPLPNEWIKKCDIYIQWSTTQSKEMKRFLSYEERYFIDGLKIHTGALLWVKGSIDIGYSRTIGVNPGCSTQVGTYGLFQKEESKGAI